MTGLDATIEREILNSGSWIEWQPARQDGTLIVSMSGQEEDGPWPAPLTINIAGLNQDEIDAKVHGVRAQMCRARADMINEIIFRVERAVNDDKK